jgi:hypothetical protein
LLCAHTPHHIDICQYVKVGGQNFTTDPSESGLPYPKSVKQLPQLLFFKEYGLP